MAAPIPSTEPAVLIAGDSASWTKSFSDYPTSDGYSLSYAFRLENGAGVLNLTAASSTSEFTLSLTAASSNLMKPGRWLWASYITLGTERHQIQSGHIEVTPNLATIDYSIDFRSTAKKAYDNALEIWGRVNSGESVTLNGRTFTHHNLATLAGYVERCRLDYAYEQQAEQFAQTGINPRHIKVRLSRV